MVTRVNVLVARYGIDEQVVRAKANVVAQDAAGAGVVRRDVILDHVDRAFLEQLVLDVEIVEHDHFAFLVKRPVSGSRGSTAWASCSLSLRFSSFSAVRASTCCLSATMSKLWFMKLTLMDLS